MKNKITLMFLMTCLFWMRGIAQVSINTDGSAPNTSAMLDVKSTTKGFLPPRMSKADMSAIASPASGLVVFCTDCNNGAGCLSVYDGAWRCAGNQPVFETSCGTLRVYYPVSAAGYTWLDRNLGASQVAQSSTDYMAYGSSYQWGRQSDGHQCINWTSSTTGTPQNGTTTTQCSNGTCADALFVTRSGSPWDWNTPSSNILWNGGTKGANDPCPTGYRVPSQAELTALNATFSPQTSVGAFSSPVKMPVAGYRYYLDGSLLYTGSRGNYWSSTYGSSFNDDALSLAFYSSDSYISNDSRAIGFSVRCIAE